MEEELSRFTECTYARFLQRREEWIKINDEESQTALKTFQAIPHGFDLNSLAIQQSCFCYTCYRRFTDKSKLERAQKTKGKVVDCKADDLKTPSPQKKSMTTKITYSVAGLSTSIERRNKDILPPVCLICKKSKLFIIDKIN